MAEEDLDSDMYSCKKCKVSGQLTKKFTLKSLPTVLCLHIKRFRWEPPKRTKITTPLDLPLKLNLEEHCASSTSSASYELYSMVSHHGKKSGCGHYTAHCLIDDSWFHFNDRSVKSCSEEDLQKQQGYLLFYKKLESEHSSSVPPTIIDLCD